MSYTCKRCGARANSSDDIIRPRVELIDPDELDALENRALTDAWDLCQVCLVEFRSWIARRYAPRAALNSGEPGYEYKILLVQPLVTYTESGMVQVNDLASKGWRIIGTVTGKYMEIYCLHYTMELEL